MSDTHHAPVPRPMSRRTGLLIKVLVFAVPAVLLAVIGWRIGNHYTALGILFLWCALFFKHTFVVVEGMTFAVTVQYGRYSTTLFAGVQCVVWEVETIFFIGDMTPKSIELYLNARGEREHLDFKDGSAKALATAWWQIADPEAIRRWDVPAMREQIVRYVFRTEARARDGLIKSAFESIYRSVLEPNMIDAVTQKSKELAHSATVVIKEIISEIGAFPAYSTSITLEGLELTKEQRDMRMAPMRGRMKAEEAVQGADAHIKPLIAMIEQCKAAGIDLSHNEAVTTFLTQQVIDALPHLRGPVNLVGKDISQIIGMMLPGTVPGHPARSLS